MKRLEIGRLPQLPFDMTEALNQLRVNLSFCGDSVKTIMVTSSVPGEGKSFLVMQLWKMVAELGILTLLIDCDLRKSEIRNKYNIRSDEAITGVAHYLAGKATLDDATYQTNVPNGYMIPVNATVANPSILLENDRFGRMIQASRERFGCVLIDTPPLGSVADALKIATHCDGTVLVVRSGDTPRKLVEDSVQLLRRTETPLLGVVLNRADIGSKSNMYYRRYYRSSYYYNGDGYGQKKHK